jgi:beta-galactosidase
LSPSSENLNRDWLFALGPEPGADAIGFDDTAWRSVHLPHDWAISGPYQPKGDPNTGKLPWRGEGWYRKHFTLPKSAAGKRVYLDFDGAMAMPTVYVNGKKAGGWDYGYISFRFDATDFVMPGQSNVVAVHLDTRSHNSRWYPGAGLYRKVQLVISDPVHIAHWGTWVATPDVSDTSATVRVQTSIENHEAQEAQVEIETSLLDPAGLPRGKQRVPLKIAAGTNAQAETVFIVSDPHRWDVERPRLYSAQSRVLIGHKVVDTMQTRFGIRTFQFTANDGFYLNGRRVQLKGVNLHHDHGPLGASFYRRAMERQLQVMKDMGVNAVRTSHNPPAPELLDLCDEMGLVVWNEAR